MDVLGRYRNLIVLVGVLFAQVLGLAVQVKRTTDGESTHLIRIWAVDTVTPLEKILAWTHTSSGDIWHNYFYLRGVRAENRELKREIERMRLEQVRMTQDADQARRLQALLGFKEQFISKTVAAQVIGSSGSEQSRSLYIDKGERDGIRPDMSVITKDGIVGKVLSVYGSTSLVLLIDDTSSGVGVILEGSRLQGILRGTASGEVQLEKVMSDETVPVGEQVLTSGGDGIFPKGLPVGTVTRVAPGSDLFLNIRVRPAADLSRLEEVLVVTKIDERQAEPDQSTAQRAVDILAERLPSVPVKTDTPDASGKPSTAAPDGTAKPNATANPAAPAGPPKTSPPSATKPQTASAAAVSGNSATGAAVKTVGSNNATEPKTGTQSTTAGGTAAPKVKAANPPSIANKPAASPRSPASSTAATAAAAKKPVAKPTTPAVTPTGAKAPKSKGQPAAQDSAQ